MDNTLIDELQSVIIKGSQLAGILVAAIAFITSVFLAATHLGKPLGAFLLARFPALLDGKPNTPQAQKNAGQFMFFALWAVAWVAELYRMLKDDEDGVRAATAQLFGWIILRAGVEAIVAVGLLSGIILVLRLR